MNLVVRTTVGLVVLDRVESSLMVLLSEAKKREKEVQSDFYC